MQKTRGHPLTEGVACLAEKHSKADFDVDCIFELQKFKPEAGLVTQNCPLEEKDSLALSPPGNVGKEAVLLPPLIPTIAPE